MTTLPDVLSRGERARLFPVLAETSKEGRTLSIFLSCLQHVDELGRGMLASVGVRVGARSRIETFTEVVLTQHPSEKSLRPDGLIFVRGGSRQWSALVEAKVGATELTTEQISGYVDLARLNGLDAVITLSNQFAPLPSHHPVALPASATKKMALFHWSWMYVLTEATLLLSNEEVADRDQRVILNEMVRFLTHQSAGVKGFDQMPASWTALVGSVQAGGSLSPSSPDTREIVAAWHQEVRDLSLILSRQLGRDVAVQIPRAHVADPLARQKADLDTLAKEACLQTTLLVPDAAAPIEVRADLQKRSISISMKLRAPADRKSTRARLTWLMRQLQRADPTGIHLRLFWPGRAIATQHPLIAVRDNPDIASGEREQLVVLSFEVLLVRDLSGRFAQRRTFISDIQAAVPDFYEQVGQHLKAWQPLAPKLREDKAEPASVAPSALRDDAEAEALARNAVRAVPNSERDATSPVLAGDEPPPGAELQPPNGHPGPVTPSPYPPVDAESEADPTADKTPTPRSSS